MTQQALFEIYRLYASLYVAAARLEVPELPPADGHDHPEIRQEMARARRELPAPPARQDVVDRSAQSLFRGLRWLFVDRGGRLARRDLSIPELDAAHAAPWPASL